MLAKRLAPVGVPPTRHSCVRQVVDLPSELGRINSATKPRKRSNSSFTEDSTTVGGQTSRAASARSRSNRASPSRTSSCATSNSFLATDSRFRARSRNAVVDLMRSSTGTTRALERAFCLLDVNVFLLDGPGNDTFGSNNTLPGTFEKSLARLDPLLEGKHCRLRTGHPQCLDQRLCVRVRLPQHLDRILQPLHLGNCVGGDNFGRTAGLTKRWWCELFFFFTVVKKTSLWAGRGPLRTCTHPDGTSRDCHPLRGIERRLTGKNKSGRTKTGFCAWATKVSARNGLSQNG